MMFSAKSKSPSDIANATEEELICVSQCCSGSIVIVPASEQGQYVRGQSIILGLGLLIGGLVLLINAFA